MYKNTNKNEKGAAILIAIILFLFISMTIILGMVNPILKQTAISKNIIYSKESYYLAEGALEDAVYRLKNNKNITSGETMTLNGYITTINITTTGSGKTIDTISDREGIFRKMQSQLIVGVGASFNYGVQTGVGGFNLTGNARVVGNVYSNGNITGESNAAITGTAIAANGSALTSDQSNGNGTPTYDVSFSNTSSTQDFAQSFQVSVTDVVNKVRIYIKKVGNPSNLTVRITANSTNKPANSSLATGSLSASLISTNYGWVDVAFSTNPQLTLGTTYWIVIDGSTNSSNYYKIGGNDNGYTNGISKIGSYGGTWNTTSPSTLDGYFNVYLGGLISIISGMDVGTGTTGDARANTVNNSTVYGNLYCQNGTGNNKSCNTTQPDPTQVSMPISDQNILDWKEDATVGGVYSGNYSLGNNNSASLGPKEITGNLTVDGNAVLTVTGTLWVHGNITLGGNGVLRLASSYGTNSGVVVTDGNINFSGNNGIQGSGQTGSFVLLLTTSTCPVGTNCGGGSIRAITLGGNAGAVILNAQKGTIIFTGNAQVNQATAKTIEAGGNTTVTYINGLADINFSSGPSGDWNISSWNEVE